jgi:hypothetical protein
LDSAELGQALDRAIPDLFVFIPKSRRAESPRDVIVPSKPERIVRIREKRVEYFQILSQGRNLALQDAAEGRFPG